ncbi:hypothetical protein A1D30_17075 [Acidovorax sp. GW101-3H11]|uniref:hypothetical protein n=1 Tax=Acidovorax sp. GW101-3H11 TaxID=1813946 RepID=UPI0007B5108A|nr:hypothetical protein [Acidovorax sp. GW101-3H11]KZT13349.1 hypothetical protein A1D30_24160 [Acidovorax sp. GW101-3H11]KZT14789.1 hypothetical protein A1D30_17075 [Acidovorax sp. GW101-3H11]
MKNNGDRSLKSLNMKWLVLLAITDVLALLFFVAPELVKGASLTQVGIGRVLIATMMPVFVLLVVNVLPHNLKSALVYWKPLGVLPGTEAFTKYGPADSRIDMAALKRNIGTLPTEPAEQNARWYKLYKQIANEPEVAEAHKLFLMYRDMAGISLVLLVLVPVALQLADAPFPAQLLATGLFVIQYLVTAVSSRWSGIRFVCNVLAVHSARKVTALKASAPKQPAA